MTDIVMPKFGLTMTEGQITRWAKSVGERVEKDEILFEVETDKVTNEVLAAEAGTLAEILYPEGTVVPVGEVIGRLGTAAGAAPAAPAAPQTAAAPSRGEDAPSARVLMAEHGIARAEICGSGRDGRIMKEDVQRVIATPLARRMAKAEGVDLTSLSGSGPGGRIKAVDVTTALTAAPKAAAIAPPSASPTAMGQPQVPSAVRAATARRVQAAKRDIPHFYLTKTVEVSALNRLRSDLNGAGSHDKITLTPMLARAAALALKAHPELNAIWLPEGILDLPTIGVGIVAETPQGLRIPVIDRADELALDDLAREANALIGRARAGTLSTQDVSGGVISISNVGMFGADTLTPIISPPQAMILGVGAESQLFRPDANGAPSLRREMTLTLAADHRLIDGAMAARYLATLAALLERPLALLRPHPRG